MLCKYPPGEPIHKQTHLGERGTQPLFCTACPPCSLSFTSSHPNVTQVLPHQGYWSWGTHGGFAGNNQGFAAGQGAQGHLLLLAEGTGVLPYPEAWFSKGVRIKFGSLAAAACRTGALGLSSGCHGWTPCGGDCPKPQPPLRVLLAASSLCWTSGRSMATQ